MIFEEDLYEGDPRQLRQKLWRVEICFAVTIDGRLSQKISDALEDIAVSVFLHNREATDGDNWTVELITLDTPDTADMVARLKDIGLSVAEKDIVARPVEQKDWLLHVHENFPPITLGRFYIYGSHIDTAPPKNLIPLKIDAATAFGSGEHETTQGCLEQLTLLHQSGDFAKGLDMGCGSGILAVAMKKLWPGMKVMAVDIDPESVTVTARHADMNGVLDITALEGNGYAAPEVALASPYDLIVANILAGPLISMAPDLVRHLAPGGFCVLSGLLTRQMEEVMAAHTALGLIPSRTLTIGDWQALCLQKPL